MTTIQRLDENARRLRVGYSLDNFETLLAEVERQSGSLLAPGEGEFRGAFLGLSLDARRLYARLVSRRGPWFRRDRLHYPEIDCVAAVDELLAADFAVLAEATPSSNEARLELASRAELLDLVGPPGLFGPAATPEQRQLPRRALAALARAALGSDAAAAARFADCLPLLRLLHLETVDVFRLLFFGSLERGLEEFVLVDLGLQRYEPVPIDRESAGLTDRSTVEHHLRLHRQRQRIVDWDRSKKAGERPPLDLVAETLAALHPRCDARCQTIRRLRDTLVLWTARAFERREELEAALSLFEGAERPPARERRVRILTRLGRSAEAAALQREIAAAPRDESERVFAERGAPGRRRARPDPPFLELRLAHRAPTQSIEAAALGELEARGYRGFFAENWLWRSLCGLSLWDLVFAPIPGAFTHRFQSAPHDLHDGFRAAREPALSERLAELAGDSMPGPRLLARWDEKFGTANPLVAFIAELRPSLAVALDLLAGHQIAMVLERLSRDLRRHGSGFPDLFLIDPNGEILLAEVKGPSDVLRPEQEAWIDHMNRGGLAAVVLHVRT